MVFSMQVSIPMGAFRDHLEGCHISSGELCAAVERGDIIMEVLQVASDDSSWKSEVLPSSCE